MKKLSLYVFLVLMFSLFTSHSFAAKKHKIYKKLPCSFNGAIIKTPANPDITKKPRGGRCCPNCKGYLGKQGTEIKKKEGYPIVAIQDMELLFADDYSSEYRCTIDTSTQFHTTSKSRRKILKHPLTGKKVMCTYPYDGVSLMFKVIKSGALVRYYHLKNTPLVPGFKMGKCKPRKFYSIYTEGDRPQTVGAEYCGGIKKQFVKKGEVIGTVGYADGAHFSLGINPMDGRGWVREPESKFQWENLPTDSDVYLFPVMNKKYLKKIGYYNWKGKIT